MSTEPSYGTHDQVRLSEVSSSNILITSFVGTFVGIVGERELTDVGFIDPSNGEIVAGTEFEAIGLVDLRMLVFHNGQEIDIYFSVINSDGIYAVSFGGDGRNLMPTSELLERLDPGDKISLSNSLASGDWQDYAVDTIPIIESLRENLYLFDFQLLSVDQTNIQYQDDIFSLEAAKNDGPVYIGIVGNVAYSSED